MKRSDERKKKRSAKHEAKGDALMLKSKPAKALKSYRKALELDEGNGNIYDKLHAAQSASTDVWDVDDFAESVSWAMRKQELENPSIKQLHAKLTPEWERAMMIAMMIINSPDENETSKMTQELIAMGEVSTRVLLEMILEMKKKASTSGEAP